MARTPGQAAGLRRDNLSRLLLEVHVHGRMSRSELARRIGVDRSTVAVLVDELARRGLVHDRPPAPHRAAIPGRPSRVVELRAEGPVVLAMEIGTDSLAAAVVGFGGRVLASHRVPTSRGSRPPAPVVADLVALALPLVEGTGGWSRVLAIGISIPGIVRREDGVIRIAPNLEWREVPLARLVGEALGRDLPVLVANDADLAALAEHTRGSGVGRSDFICLWGEAGLGAGIVVGGRPLTGRAGYAGEVGHIPVNPDGLPCHCGSSGCWETEVGEDALLRGASGSAGSKALDELFAAADAGAPEANEALDRVAHWLAVGITALVDIFDPDLVAMGALYARIHACRGEAIAREVAARAVVGARDAVRLAAVRFGADAALLGAAELALGPTLQDPTALHSHEGRPIGREHGSSGRAGRDGVGPAEGGEAALAAVPAADSGADLDARTRG
ncbi:MAG TPA: ROK family transcriptional regulator [Candidatus Limnocylindrales bacterium]